VDDVPPPPDPDDAPAPPSSGARGNESVSEPAERAPNTARDAAGPAAEGGALELAQVRSAWEAVVDAGEGVPQGMARFLKLAGLTLTGPRALAVEVLPVVLERFGDVAARRPLEAALARRVGPGVKLTFVAGRAPAEEPGAQRITAQSAKRDRLQRLAEGEPVLTAAVQAWDLELLD
jgi:hypothetical protein